MFDKTYEEFVRLRLIKSKYGAWHFLFCADISDQSHFPAASPGVSHQRFGKTGALIMPQDNVLQIAIDPILLYFLLK